MIIVLKNTSYSYISSQQSKKLFIIQNDQASALRFENQGAILHKKNKQELKENIESMKVRSFPHTSSSCLSQNYCLKDGLQNKITSGLTIFCRIPN